MVPKPCSVSPPSCARAAGCCCTSDANASSSGGVFPASPTQLGHEVPCKWQGHEAVYQGPLNATVADLKQWLASLTQVPPSRQRLMGWAKLADGKAIGDETPLSTLHLSAKRLMMLGTPEAAHAAAELELERGKRTQRLIANDLKPPPPPPRPLGPMHRRSNPKPSTPTAVAASTSIQRFGRRPPPGSGARRMRRGRTCSTRTRSGSSGLIWQMHSSPSAQLAAATVGWVPGGARGTMTSRPLMST